MGEKKLPYLPSEEVQECPFLMAVLSGRSEAHRFSPAYLKIVAPMVRYSKLPFRLLCRKWGADLAFTPMIIAEGFNRSQKARDSEFTTNGDDQPLVVQFGTPSPIELGLASEKVHGFAQAIDLNCGCPQRWAAKTGIGAVLSAKPELVKQMVSEVRKRSSIPVSIKIRIHEDLRRTVDLIQQAEAAGVAWITVHGRTIDERRTPVHYDAIKMIKETSKVPIFANGDGFSHKDCDRIVEETGVDGVMCARGILDNPAMFAGYDQVPMECVQDYFDLALAYGGLYSLHHHHMMYMLYGHITRADRTEFSLLRSLPGIHDFFDSRGWLRDYGASTTTRGMLVKSTG